MPPDEAKSLDEIAGLLDATPAAAAAGSDEAGDDASEIDNSAENGANDEQSDDNSEADAEETDGAAEGDDAGDAEGEKDAGAQDEEPFFTVKLDDKEVKVSRSEAQAGYLRQADYTRKTQEIATQRQAAEAEVAAYRANREQYAKILNVLQERIGDEKSDPTAEQWNELRESDPDRYAIEWADFGRRREQREKIKAEQKRIDDEKAGERVTALKTYLGEQRTKLLEVLPEWKDPVKATAGMARVREYAKTVGFTDAELDQAYDHRMIVAVDKARRYDALMAEKKKALKKVDNAPDMAAPGNRAPKVDPKKKTREAAKTELRKSGKLEDNLSLLDA